MESAVKFRYDWGMEKTDMVRIGKLIEKAREDARLTQPEAAERIGISDRQLRTWEKGKLPQQWEALADLCKTLNTSADHLLDVEIKKPPSSEAEELIENYIQLSAGQRWVVVQLCRLLLLQSTSESVEDNERLRRASEIYDAFQDELRAERRNIDA